MASDALRQVFAEFGFKVDDAPLEKMLADTERQIKLEEKLSAAEKKVLAETRKAQAEKEKATAKAADDAEKAEKAAADEAEKAAEKAAKEAEKKAEEEQKRRQEETRADEDSAAKAADFAKAKLLGVAAAVGAIVVAAHRFAAAFAADAMALRETADAARVTETQFQQLTFAGAAVGVSAETTGSALNTLGEGLRAIEARTGGPTNALHRLGVRARETDGTMRGTNDVLYDLADRFERVRSPVHRARLAQELFGASGRRMLQVLAGGSAALRRQQEDFASLGGGVLPEAVEESRRFSMAQARMGVALNSIHSVLATFLLPIFTRATNVVAGLIGWFSRMTRGTHILNGVLVAVGVAGAASGGAIVAAWLPVIAPIAAAVLGAIALALAFDDIQNLLEGHDSLIGSLIDNYAGFGASARFVERIRDAWNQVAAALARVNEAVSRLPSWAQTGVDIATFGLRGFLPAGQSAGAAGDERAPPEEARTGAAPPLLRRGSRRAPASQPPAQPMMPQANVAAWASLVPQLAVPGARPSTTIPAPRGGSRTVIDRSQTNNQITVTGVSDPRQAAEQVVRLLDERQRRQRDRSHPDDAED